MPKSTRKKKDKAADFTKAKLKLGKGKRAPSNAVDTSFKARSIALPSQSIAHDRASDVPTTKRKLTFDDLIAYLKHYNASTRRDAILGLRELLDSHPELILPNLTVLINSCVRVIGDEDANIRKTLLSFFGWLLPQIPHEDLVPHTPILLLFTTSAQTHIFPEIRIDAIRFLDLFLEVLPELVTEGWLQPSSHGRRVLEGYLGILNAGTTFGEGGDTGHMQATSTASVVLSMGSKLIALKSLSSFLQHALATSSNVTSFSSDTHSHTAATPTWFLAPYFASFEAFDAFDALLRPSFYASFSVSGPHQQVSETWSPETDMESNFEKFQGTYELAKASVGDSFALQDLMNLDVQDSTRSLEGSSVKVSFAAHLARTLYPTLTATFLDCAPAVFSPSVGPPETELQMVLVIAEICLSLYGAVLREPAESAKGQNAVEDLKLILGYFAPYFPFIVSGSTTARRDIKIEQVYQDLNLIYCELTSFLVLASPESSNLPAKQPNPRRSKPSKHFISAPASSALPAVQTSHVRTYVVQLLRGEAAPAPGSLARPITPAAYSALLPTIWSLLNSPRKSANDNDPDALAVLGVMVEHALRASSTSAVKRHTVDFLARLVLLEREPEYRGAFKAGLHADQDRRLEEWIQQLPRTLWELGAGSLPTTETILRFLLRLCERNSPLLRDEVVSSLRMRLVPYFVVTHETRGRLSGPFAKLPTASPLRMLALDVAATLTGTGPGGQGVGHGDGDGDGDDLEAAVREAVRSTEVEAYWKSVKRRT
ncbi:uncharacterized protein LAESUDRAFT_726516 [Laetiporus sulphureus 93-53]|uniref:Pre-rRNA-processing protein n=1 Tax=Laetiporus sulphureus 93-53 TaxID=1314785 RepID=A0A165DZD1_9APHY|nr:uncharacterized protein LAESUDRAFT_726516 [Laetiporus sulphureus 93-53]KZT05948.1 hypothetical protein LAESUDRAFT_726516 [Laetiporus sulphureus 93-53]